MQINEDTGRSAMQINEDTGRSAMQINEDTGRAAILEILVEQQCTLLDMLG